MFELFSDFVAAQTTPLSRVDPRVRCLGAAALLLAVIFSSRLWLPLGVFGVCVAALLLLRIKPSLILLRIGSPAALVAVVVTFQAFVGTGTPVAAFNIFGWDLVVTEDGLWRAALIAARVLGAVGVMVLLSFSTPVPEICQALRWLRFPATLVEITLLMYRYIFVLVDQASDIAVAQRVRLGYATMPRLLHSLGTLAGTVIVRSYDQSLRTHEAMLMRGYNGRIPIGPLPALQPRHWLWLSLVVLTPALVFCAIEQPKLLFGVLEARR